MNTPATQLQPALSRSFGAGIALWLLLLARGISGPEGRAAETAAMAGSVSGQVINRTTGNGLEGARVELPRLGRTTLVDATGRYVLPGVPAGSHELVASYTGLEAGRAVIVVPAGGRAVHDFERSGGRSRRGQPAGCCSA